MAEDPPRIIVYKGNQKYEYGADVVKSDLTNYIQVENLNILIGAGCSSYKKDGDEKGIPTMGELSRLLFEKHPELANEEINQEKVVSNDDLKSNIELLLNRLTSMEIVFENNTDDIRKIKKTITDFIFNEVSKTNCIELLDLYKQFYLRLEKETRKTPINIYTTNYDLYNESALDDLGIPYNNGFLGSAKRQFNPNSYNYILVEELDLDRKTWKPVSNFINLFKIHGSVNWIKEKDTDSILEKDIDYAKIRSDAMMIYPSPLKDRSTLMTPYSDLFRMMQNNLLKPDSILITIGYSFSDDHINRLIFNALSSVGFKLIIIGKSKHIDKIIEKNYSKIWVIQSNDDLKIHYFENVIKYILPSINEEIEKQMKEKISLSELQNLFTGDNSD